MLAFTDSSLARLCIGATAIAPHKRDRWLKDIAAKLDPPRAIIRRRERSRRGGHAQGIGRAEVGLRHHRVDRAIDRNRRCFRGCELCVRLLRGSNISRQQSRDLPCGRHIAAANHRRNTEPRGARALAFSNGFHRTLHGRIWKLGPKSPWSRAVGDRSNVVTSMTDDERRELNDLMRAHDQLMCEDRAWMAGREAAAASPVRKSDDDGLVYRTGPENAQARAAQPDAEPSSEGDNDELDPWMEAVVEFVCMYTAGKLKQRDTKIAKLETQVETLLTLLGADKAKSVPQNRDDDSVIVELPHGFLRKTHHG